MEPDRGGGLQRWVDFGTNIIAPATVLSALLFYYGYVSSRAQYQYFGIDVDVIGLSTQDYVMRSPQPLLVPLLVLTLLGAGLLVAHSAIRARIAAAEDAGALAGAARFALLLGAVALAAGVGLLLGYGFLGGWPYYGLATPLLIALGAALTDYAARTLRLLRPRAEPPSSVSGRKTAGVLLCGVVVASVFWATATVAQWSGRGLAQEQARRLDGLPAVILDTRDRLFLRSPGIEETSLPDPTDQGFHFRYRHLRLLIVGHDRMFLVPAAWSASDSTLVVPLGDSARVQFQFQNQPP